MAARFSAMNSFRPTTPPISAASRYLTPHTSPLRPHLIAQSPVRNYVRPSNIPRASGWVPGLGNTLSLLRNPFQMHSLLDSYAQEGSLVQLKIGPLDAILVSSVEATREVLQGKSFVDRPQVDLDDFFRDLCGMAKGIGLSTGDHWEIHRRIANATLASPKVVQSFARSVSETADNLVAKWAKLGDDAEVTINHDLDSYALDSIGQLAFGEKFNALDGSGNPLADAVRDVLYSTQKLAYLPMPIYRYIRTPTVKKIEASALVVKEKGLAAIERKRRQIARGINVESDDMDESNANFISLLLSTKDEISDRYLSDPEIMGDVLDVIAAGQETTATLLTWFLHLISKDLPLQQTLRDEIRANQQQAATNVDENFSSKAASGYLNYDDVMSAKKYPQLSAAIKETLRLYPSIGFFMRQTTEETTLAGHDLPAKQPLLLSPYILGRSSKVWEDPLRFDPSRYSRPFDPFGWIPFSAGRRSCVGMRVALLEAKIAIIKLLSAFEIHPAAIPSDPRVITKLVSIGTDSDIVLKLKHCDSL